MQKTSLIVASEKGFTEIVDILIKNKADVNVKDKYEVKEIKQQFSENFNFAL